MPDAVQVRVPATTANLGPGFDTLGLALALYNEVELRVADQDSVEVRGEGQDCLPRDGSHLVLRSARLLAERAGRAVPGWQLVQSNAIPLARGLGSSSAAIVAGLFGADALLGTALPRSEILALAAEIEGHPDNVAPAIFGGLVVCCTDGGLSGLPLPAPDLQVVAAIPNFEVSTEAARKVMPATIPHADGVYNASHVALTVAALMTGEFVHLRVGMRDRLHQPYRAHLIPGFEATCAAALDAGAHGVALSGSGPTIAAFCTDHAPEVAAAMVTTLLEAGVEARTLILDTDREGAKVLGR
ncbi:MAG: homoserine kinase [Armatimonadetes bacterium]|nr:homoserine kinase [Armatimonadota bacterium]